MEWVAWGPRPPRVLYNNNAFMGLENIYGGRKRFEVEVGTLGLNNLYSIYILCWYIFSSLCPGSRSIYPKFDAYFSSMWYWDTRLRHTVPFGLSVGPEQRGVPLCRWRGGGPRIAVHSPIPFLRSRGPGDIVDLAPDLHPLPDSISATDRIRPVGMDAVVSVRRIDSDGALFGQGR